jgi:hypothetical protein
MREDSRARRPRMAACGPSCGRLLGLALVATLLALPGALGHAPGSAPPRSAPLSLSVSSTPASNAPSSWTNISSSVGAAPFERSISQAAYSPALGESILFGGYYGGNGNVALGDTWSFADNAWTNLSPPVSPSPRWGATMVYDPVDQALVLFGGRDDTTFYNDTWEYNASGWHNISTATAPSPRYDYGLAYDAAIGAVVLYGGAIGNVPAGTFTNFVYYSDTWTFQNGTWTNVTYTAGPGPALRLLRGQLTYDALDGYVIATGGYSYVPLGNETSCGYVVFNRTWGQTWEFKGGAWSESPPSNGSPPDGVGVLWYDPQANETLYYEGMWLAPGGLCDEAGNVVWSYAGGNWTLVTEGNVSAPSAREQPVFVDDETDHEQLMFGGEQSATASEYFANYFNDTWTYQPTWVTFEGEGLPVGSSVKVTLSGSTAASSGKPLLFVVAPGQYSYDAMVWNSSHSVLGHESGSFALVHGPAVVQIRYRDLGPLPPSTGPGGLAALFGGWPTAAAGVTVGAVAVGLWAGVGALRQRARLRKEGERLVRSMLTEPPESPR